MSSEEAAIRFAVILFALLLAIVLVNKPPRPRI
jgi:hypothetical protein